jgi:hypothetical protein
MSRYSHEPEDRMSGRVIDNVELSDDQSRITITFADGTRAVGSTNADCCSETWVEALTVPPDIKGATVTGYSWSEDVPQDTPTTNAPADTFLDQIEVYGEAIATDRGEIIIEYRNSSNGYYGGSLDWTVPA